MKRVLLTGATGMVGRNFLEHPSIKKYDILAPRRDELDLYNYDEVLAYLNIQKPDMIIHAAGKVGGILANSRYPVEFLLQNMDMGRNLIWASYNAGVKKFVNLGSSCMYPRNFNTPLKEEQVLTGELEPTNEGYAIAKIFSARLCEYISREYPLFHYKTLIPCNLFGRWDKFDPEQAHLIPAIIRKLHDAVTQHWREVEIWGDGQACREFLYAGDMADCLIKTIEEFDTLPAVMNVGMGTDYTIDEYYHMCAEVVGFSGDFCHDLTKPAGMQRKLVDVSKQDQWGWTPAVDIKTGIKRTYEYYLQYVV